MNRSPEDIEASEKKEPQAAETTTAKSIEPPRKKFHNGWTKQLEVLVAEWADKSACYRWMHEKTEAIFTGYNMSLTIPVIILSTLTGTANFAVESFLPDPSYAKYATAAIGTISIVTGIISTVANFLRYAQSSEAHRVAGVSWGKFQRLISTELALHPNERMDAMSFLKMGRIELDRLIEQSPTIPPKIIILFEIAFKDKRDIKRPEIAGGIEHTRIFEDRDSRIAKIASEAAFLLQQKRGYMKKLIVEDLDKHIANRTKEERAQLEQEMMAEIVRTARETAAQVVSQRLPTPAIKVATTVTQRSPPKIPQNTVFNTRAKFEQEANLTKSQGSLHADLINELSRKNLSPTQIRLEIVPDESAKDV